VFGLVDVNFDDFFTLAPLSHTLYRRRCSTRCCPDSERLANQLSKKKISASLELTGKPQWENFCLANRLLTGHGPNVGTSFFANRVVDIWNYLPDNIIDFNSLSAFKRTVKLMDFTIFLKCD